jgi:hypothetical protein
MMETLVGVVDTTFARVDMGASLSPRCARLLATESVSTPTLRRTVPGLKDIAVEAKVLIEEEGATWPGPVENLAETATEVITSALKCSEWRWVRAREGHLGLRDVSETALIPAGVGAGSGVSQAAASRPSTGLHGRYVGKA